MRGLAKQNIGTLDACAESYQRRARDGLRITEYPPRGIGVLRLKLARRSERGCGTRSASEKIKTRPHHGSPRLRPTSISRSKSRQVTCPCPGDEVAERQHCCKSRNPSSTFPPLCTVSRAERRDSARLWKESPASDRSLIKRTSAPSRPQRRRTRQSRPGWPASRPSSQTMQTGKGPTNAAASNADCCVTAA
jgi:hypothetical protein